MKLSEAQRAELRSKAPPEGYDGLVASRAQIVLLDSEGHPAAEIVAMMGTSKVTVYKWVGRYQEGGAPAPESRKSPGRPREVPGEVRSRIIALTKQTRPENTGFSHWSSYEMARYLRRHEGISVSHNFISVLWRDNGIKPHRQGLSSYRVTQTLPRRSWMSWAFTWILPRGDRPVGRREDAGPGLDRTQSLLPVSFGKTEKRTHDYVRHGTTNLFAALNTGTGKITSDMLSRRRT